MKLTRLTANELRALLRYPPSRRLYGNPRGHRIPLHVL